MGEQLEGLKRVEARATNDLRTLRSQIEKLEDAELLPTLRKKYEGKYFKFRNSRGLDSWLLYVYCRKVMRSRFNIARVDTFQITPQECEFHAMAEGGEFLFQTQITKREWDRALRALKARVERLGKA